MTCDETIAGQPLFRSLLFVISPTRRWRIWMEPNHLTATAPAQEVVAKIDQKALRLSALLREIDNHPIELESVLRDQLDDVLEMLACRISATRKLLHRSRLALSGA